MEHFNRVIIIDVKDLPDLEWAFYVYVNIRWRGAAVHADGTLHTIVGTILAHRNANSLAIIYNLGFSLIEADYIQCFAQFLAPTAATSWSRGNISGTGPSGVMLNGLIC